MNNRRDFLKTILLGCASAAILPAALTYKRSWKPLPSGICVKVSPADPMAIHVISLGGKIVHHPFEKSVSLLIPANAKVLWGADDWPLGERDPESPIVFGYCMNLCNNTGFRYSLTEKPDAQGRIPLTTQCVLPPPAPSQNESN